MQAVKTIGLDIAKSVFQVHGVDVDGPVVIRRKLKRRYVLTFLEKLPACIGLGSRHCWRDARPRSPLSRLPTNSREWCGP